jgi:hypothetical protein
MVTGERLKIAAAPMAILLRSQHNIAVNLVEAFAGFALMIKLCTKFAFELLCLGGF